MEGLWGLKSEELESSESLRKVMEGGRGLVSPLDYSYKWGLGEWKLRKASEDLKIVEGVESFEGLKNVVEGGVGMASPLYYTHYCEVGVVEGGEASKRG